jgi:hypothetical protein
MDRVIFGDNQFFGVSHLSEERGMERLRRFQDTREIIKVIDAAYARGIHGFTFSTHDRVAQICDHFRANRARYASLRLYPVLPYAQKHAHKVNEKGVAGAIADVLLADNSIGGAFGMLVRGSMAFLTQDPLKVMSLLVDVEMKMFRDLPLGAVFLQNNVADLLLGFGIKDVFRSFVKHVESKHNTRAGFMTLNLPRMVKFLTSAGIERPLVCTAINKIGFQMNPDVEAYHRAVVSDDADIIAMSVMAAGMLRPREAFEYISSLGNVKSLVYGASTEGHIESCQGMLQDIGWR